MISTYSDSSFANIDFSKNLIKTTLRSTTLEYCDNTPDVLCYWFDFPHYRSDGGDSGKDGIVKT